MAGSTTRISIGNIESARTQQDSLDIAAEMVKQDLAALDRAYTRLKEEYAHMGITRGNLTLLDKQNAKLRGSYQDVGAQRISTVLESDYEEYKGTRRLLMRISSQHVLGVRAAREYSLATISQSLQTGLIKQVHSSQYELTALGKKVATRLLHGPGIRTTSTA